MVRVGKTGALSGIVSAELGYSVLGLSKVGGLQKQCRNDGGGGNGNLDDTRRRVNERGDSVFLSKKQSG